MCLNPAEVLATTFEEDPLGDANPIEDVELSEDGFGSSRPGGLNGGQISSAFGFSLGVHAALLALVMLMSYFSVRPCIPEATFVTVTIFEMAGSAGGPGGGSGGQGSASSGGCAPGSPQSPGLGGTGSEEAQTPLQEAEPVKDTADKKSELSPQIKCQDISKPNKPTRRQRKTTADQTAHPIEARPKPTGGPDDSLSLSAHITPGAGSGDISRGQFRLRHFFARIRNRFGGRRIRSRGWYRFG